MGDISDLFGQPFDSKQVEPSRAYEPLPTGWYQCVVTESCVKATKAGTGKYIFICWQILDGQQGAGRKVFSRHNVQNQSQKTMEIAEGEMSSIARSIGVPILEETSQLVGQACEIRVIIKNEQNDVKGFRPFGAGAAAPVAVPAVPAAMPPLAAAPIPQPAAVGIGAPLVPTQTHNHIYTPPQPAQQAAQPPWLRP